jgi:hypothetical protein
MIDLKPLRSDREAILQELLRAGAKIRKDGREIQCPFHDDKSPSSYIYENDDGIWMFKCETASCGVCGDVIEIMARNRGITSADVLRTMKSEHPAKDKPEKKKPTIFASIEKIVEALNYTGRDSGCRVVADYRYTNPETQQIELIVFRIEQPTDENGKKKKTFRQCHPVPGGFVLTAPEGKQPLYNRTRMKDSKYVVVCEGEKCVHALADIGIVATTSPGGAGKSGNADWSPCAGKDIYLWPDNDPADAKTGIRTGIKHMQEVLALIEHLEPAPNIYRIDHDSLNLPPKGDAVEYLAALPTSKNEERKIAIEALMEFSENLGPAAKVGKLIDDAISGKSKAIPFPWERISSSTRALLPGTVTILCGPPGTTKSLFVLQFLAYMFEQGISVAAMMLEDNQEYHLRRALAQKSGVGNITIDEWCETHQEEAKSIYSEYKSFLNKFGHCIFDHPMDTPKSDALLAWIKDRASKGCRVIAIDPITMMDSGDKQWIEDLRFLIRAKQIVAEFGASLILVTHPRKTNKNSKGANLDDLAGGAAFQRFSHTILWLDFKESSVGLFSNKEGIDRQFSYNRMLQVRKARNSWGAGKSIGLFFNQVSYKSEEVGLFVKASKVSEPVVIKPPEPDVPDPDLWNLPQAGG